VRAKVHPGEAANRVCSSGVNAADKINLRTLVDMLLLDEACREQNY